MNTGIKKETIIRTIVLFVTLLNSILTMRGWNPLPFSEDELYEILSEIALAASAIWTWWCNNSFTKKAIKADEYLQSLKNEGADDGDEI